MIFNAKLVYSRKNWQHWIDEDKDGQDTRQEVLISESLIAPTLRSDGKKVLAGSWHDPYTDSLFTKPSDLDTSVALKKL